MGKRAGKGPLVQWEKSGTLGVSQDQTLFVWYGASKGGGRTSMGSQGSGINHDVCFTLNSTDNHAVCYSIDHVVCGGATAQRKGRAITKISAQR